MNIPDNLFWLGIAVIIIVIAFLVNQVSIANGRIHRNAVVLMNFRGHLKLLNNQVKAICIARSCVPSITIQKYTDNVWSHWSMGCWDMDGNFVIISTSGTNSTIVHKIRNNSMRKLNDSHIMFVDNKGHTHVIKMEDIHIPCKKVKIIDIIQSTHIHNMCVDYDLIGYNCQYQVKAVMNEFVGSKYQYNTDVNKLETIKQTFKEHFNIKEPKYTGKLSKSEIKIFANNITPENHFNIDDYLVEHYAA